MACYWNRGQCAGRNGESSPVRPLAPLVQVASAEPSLGWAHRAAFITPNGEIRALSLRGTPAPAPYLSSPFPKQQLPQGTIGAHTRLFQKAKLQPFLGKAPGML